MTPDDAPTLLDWLGAGEASALDEADLADLEVAVEAVLAGAREVMRRYRGRDPMEVEEKAPDDPVTEADRAADRAIARVLRERRPGEAIRSEEADDVLAAGDGGRRGDGSGPASGHLWVVDPLDGTKEFLARNGEFAVMVGLAVEGSARLGAVYRPDPGVLYLGSTAGGAWAGRLKEDRRVEARSSGRARGDDSSDASSSGGAPSSSGLEEGPAEEPPTRGAPASGAGPAHEPTADADAGDRDTGDDAPGAAGSGSGDDGDASDEDAEPEVRSLADFRDPIPLSAADGRQAPVRLLHSRSHRPEGLERLAEVLGEVELVPLGSAGLKCSAVAAGAGDLYVHPIPYMMEWDTCAPEAVLRGAGGRVSDCRGEPLRYGKEDPAQEGGIFAGRPGTWKRARDVVRELAP
jgi:3'-phosphoadenosine 5'-phosphosulfate (PAPS) 3'-phosphatase